MHPSRYPWRYALFFMAYYAANSVFQGYMSLYYGSRGLDSGHIGAIFAAIALVSAAAQPCWGLCADRSKSRNRVLRLLAAGAAASVLTFLLADRFLPLMLLACVFSCSSTTAIQPMGDSIALAALNARGQPFGLARLAGGMTYAVAALAFGALLEVPGRESWAVWCTAALCLTIIPRQLRLAGHAGLPVKGRPQDVDLRAAEGPRTDAPDAVSCCRCRMTMGYFLHVLFADVPHLRGRERARCLAGATSSPPSAEVPYLIFSDRLFDRLGAGKLMCISGATLALRWLLLATTQCATRWQCSASCCTVGGFIVMTVAMAKHISRHRAPPSCNRPDRCCSPWSATASPARSATSAAACSPTPWVSRTCST